MLALQIFAAVMAGPLLVGAAISIAHIIRREVGFWRVRREIKRTGVKFPVPDGRRKK